MSSASGTSSRLRLVSQHELKLLNLSVIIYICFGALAFHLMGEFDGSTRHQPPINSSGTSAHIGKSTSGASSRPRLAADSLAEMRSISVQRMWNITNQLNILYESNWTKLVLDELIEFERKLMSTLERESSGRDESSGGELELELDNEHDDKSKQSGAGDGKAPKSADRKQRAQARSIKRSLVHSIATITTIGSPHVAPASPAAKLATVLYGAVGIPVLLYSVVRTGAQLARSSVNLLIILRHYCLALPAYYLCCCCTCNPLVLLRWLAWFCCCCCCCCCAHLFCPKSRRRKGEQQGGCCSRRRRPELRLVDWSAVARAELRRRRRTGGATRSGAGAERGDGGGAYVIGEQSRPGDELTVTDCASLRSKSVRFGRSQLSASQDKIAKTAQDHEDREDGDPEHEEQQLDSPYSPGLFATSALVLLGYLLLGAYMQSRDGREISLVESLFNCYQLLSMTKLPDSFAFATGSSSIDALKLYRSLSSEPASRVALIRDKIQPRTADDWTTFATDLAYFLIGLHLVAMLGHLARYFIGHELRMALAECQLDRMDLKDAAETNGPTHSLMGTASGHPTLGLVEAAQFQRMATNSGDFYVQPPANHYQPTGEAEQQQQQVDLAELVLMGQQQSPVDIYTSDGNSAQQQQQVVTSDLSLMSDRSSDPRSLCPHHQLQLQPAELQAANSPHDISGTNSSLCSVQPTAQILHHFNGYHQQQPVGGSRQSTLTRNSTLKFAQGRVVDNGYLEQESSANTLDTPRNHANSSLAGSRRRIGFLVGGSQQSTTSGEMENGFCGTANWN